jgi:hypothetical protein
VSNAWSVQDQYNQTLIYLAAATAFLGHVAEGRARLGEALTHAKELKHPFTSAFALSVAAIFESIVGSHRGAERYAAELAAISTEHGFPFYVAWANLFQGRSLAALGQPNEGFKLITNSLPMMRATGAVLGNCGIARRFCGAELRLHCMTADQRDALRTETAQRERRRELLKDWRT